MNEENLKPFVKGEERQKELGKMGGIASGEAKRKNKLLKTLLEEALSKGTETDNEYINITMALINQAKTGNVKAYEVIRDTLDQKPKEKVEHTGAIPVVIDDDIKN